MAVKDCDELSNIISLGIISWDDDLAKVIAGLSTKKKDALMRAWKLKEWEVDDLTWRSAHELELRANSADIEMRAIVQAKILNDEIRVGDAYRELAFQIRETWWTIANWVDLLEKLRNASPADFESIAKQWWGKYANDPAKAIEEMKNAIAETVSANYSIRQYSDIKSKWLNSLRKQLRDWEITQWVFEDEVKKLHKDAMEQIAKWENPKNFVKLDSEWAAIKKVYWDNPVAAGKAWSQFIMARELLSDGWIDDWVLKAFQEMGAENLTWDLTLDQIAKYWEWDLDKLLARAYTNTEQLYRDWELRQAFREKLEELTAWMRVSADDIKKANSIMKTMQFAEQWATFSDIITADNAIRSARKRWYNVSDGTAFLNSLKAFARKMDEDAKLLDKPIVINWVEMKPLDVIQIIYDITWDENILKLLRIGFYNDWTILSIATSRLLWWNKEAASKILRLFAKAWEQPRVTNVRDISLKAITWSDIKEWAKVGFFDFRQSLYSKDELNRTRADFMDKLAERNKMRVPSDWLEIINSEPVTAEVLAEELKSKVSWWYLLVNDSRWRDNDILSKALDIANEWVKEEEKITVLFPRGWMDANFSVENWQLFYKTTKDDMFRDVAWTISIQSMWEARPTREILATAYEAKTGKNWDKIRYQASYTKGAVDNQGRAISDQQYEYGFLNDDGWNVMTFYHWTKWQFDEFDLDFYRTWSWDSSIPWFWFTPLEWAPKIGSLWDANRLIEVYIKSDNPIREWATLSELMSKDELISLLERYHIAYLWDDLDIDRRWYKIDERYKNSINAKSFFSQIQQYDGIFWNDLKWFMEYFTRRTWYDWIWYNKAQFVSFKPENIKYVDNRLPTYNPDMHFMEREWSWYSLIPSKEEVDEYLSRNNISKKLEEIFWTTNNIEDAIFITADGKMIDWASFAEKMWYYTNEYSWANIWAEHRAAIDYIIFNWDRWLRGHSQSTEASRYLLTAAMQKEWLIRFRYFPDQIHLDIWVATSKITKAQESVIQKITSRMNADLKEAIDEWSDWMKIKAFVYSMWDDEARQWGWTVKPNERWTLYSDSIINQIKSLKDTTDYDKRFPWINREEVNKEQIQKAEEEWWYIVTINSPNRRTWLVYQSRDINIDSPESIKQYVYQDLDESRIWDIIDFNTFELNEEKFDKLSSKEKIQILNRIGTFANMYELEGKRWFIRWLWANEAYNDLFDRIFNSGDLKEILKKEVRWQDMFEFISKNTDDWVLPYEAMLYVDDNGKISNAILWFSWNVVPTESIIKEWWREFHNHPNWSWFSTDDISHFQQIVDRWYPVESVWLILPWWVIVEYKLTDDFFDYVRTDFVNINSAIREAIDTADILGVMDKQTWWKFQEVVDKMDIENNWWRIYHSRNDSAEEALNRISNEVRQDAYDKIRWALTPEWATEPVWMKRAKSYASQPDINAEDAVKVQMFTKDRTWQQIADAYGFPVKIVKWDMIEWVAAYWAWWNGMIYFTDMIKESTAPHELFHAIFNTYVGKEQYDRVLEDASKLFQVSKYDAEEILADSFAEWFNTWKFTYWDKIKAIGWKKRLSKQQKTFLQKVKDYFTDLAETLWLIDRHRDEVEQMFNDMVNMQYLPDVWKNVDAQRAMMKYNDELNNVAVKYFWEMLWLSTKEVDSQYVERVQKLLSEKLWIDLKSFDQLQDKAALWQRIDKQFALDRLTAWKYDKEIVDINAIKNEISNLTDEELEESIKRELWDIVARSDIKWNENIAHIREAYLDYKTAWSAVDSLMAKWKIVSLANGWTAQTMSMNDIKTMFQNWTFEKTYKEMFFPNQELSKKEMDAMITKINNDMFDTLSISFAENLVSAWYELPLINIKSLVYDYLNGKLDLNNKFVESFLYKNNIPFSQDWLKTLVDTLMPAEFKFNYEDSLFKWRLDKIELPSEASVFREVDNRFMQDSYSALASIQMARAWDMPINYEEQILTNILDKYVSEVFKWVKDKSLTFQKAQQLKQEAWYALDMFEQDFLLPRYSKFVSKQEMNGIMWMKYALPIWVAWQNPDKVNQELLSIRNKLLQKYKMTLKNAANNNDINMAIVKWTADKKLEKEIELRRDKLAESGWVIREVNWQYLVYDVKQALEETLNNLPDTIGWIEWLRVLWRDWIDRLSNKQAYAILRYVEAAKWLSTKLNYPTELMYKQNPMLLKYNFFESYRVVDWLPRVLNWNLLNGDKVLASLDNNAGLDTAAKKNIFAWVISKFREQWYITTEDLNKIVHNWVSEAQATFKQIKLSPKQIKQATEKMETLYRKAFLPYTYLRDIPKWGQLLDWTPVKNMKKKVEDTIKLQYKQAMDDLKAIWVDNADELQTSIYITLDSWERVSVKEAWNMNIDSWKKTIFNDESVFVAWADEIKSFAVDPTWDKKALDKVVKQQKEYRESIINSYDSTLQSMLNQTQIISEAEADLSTAFMNDVRTTMRRYSLTNMMVDAMDALSWLNEEAARWMKDYLIGWKWRISFWKWKPWQILERNKLVQDAYKNYYVMDLSKLNSITPTSQAEDLALRLAKYFKNLERLLWSADGLTWCTTNKEINQAFFHLWEVVMNVNSVKWIFWLMSAVEQNQILKFFKFANISNSNPASIFVRRGKWNFQESLWWYRDYVEEISWISRGEFNEIFWADFSEEDFKRILQWLTGFTLTGAWWRTWTKILNVLNWSNMIFRMMMSYPGQLLTIPQQGTAYFLKQIWFEKELWVESLSEVDAIRAHYWVLDWAYNEIVLRWKSTVSPDDLRLDSYYNRYWIPDVDWIYKTSPIETSDDYINMYAKIDKEAASSISSTNKWFRQLDPYKDNANNIIDWLFARNFKNISFLKAIKNNDFMQFGSAKEFMSFMDDATISAEIKTRLMDRVSAYSGRNFRNILWLGFGWIDRAVSWSWFGNIMYWLMQLFNFRWSWWQNIFKQTWSNIFTALKMLWTANWIWSREWREAIAQYISTRPEFTNFVWALFNDLKWTWKLQRFQDNWRWPEDEDMYGMLDFIDYMTETLNMTSQWFQWLQSFWPFRPFDEARQSIMASAMNPTIYKDTFWVWAFFNALGKNFWRQWKPYNWIAKLAWAWSTDWPDWAWAYIENEFWKLSFWSLRYMVNEDMNSYGYTYEMTWQVWGIPSIIMWESKLGSDKNFSYEIDNTETWETIKQMFDSGLPWDTRWTYAWNLAKTFINWSQLAALPKNVMKAINRSAPSYFTADDLAETMQNTKAWLEFYKKWIVTPQTPEEAEIFFNTMLENAKYRPWSSNFTKSIIQYEDYWHMNGKENWNEADAEMELWLDHMKHITNEHWEIQMNGSEKVVDPSWDKLIEDVKAHWYNETYTTDLIYNYSKNWLNNHSSDPNYQLYVKLLWQWQAYNLISTRQSQLIEALNVWAKGKDNKWTKTEFENVWLDNALLLRMWQQPLEWESISFFDKLQVLDEDDATVAALQIIQSQAKEWDRKILDRFFNVKENDDWSKSVSLKYNYEQTLKQIWAVSKAIDDWNVDLAVAEASTLVNMYKNADPTGAVTATLIDSVYNRIYDTNSFSPEQKQAAMIALFHKNKEFIQRNPEKLRALLWDDYDVYADYMNSMLYQWDWMTISNLESMQSSWKSSSWSWKAAASFSSALKNLASKLWGSWKSNWWAWGTTSSKQWVPVTIKGASLVKDLWLKGYTPAVDKISISKYKPHLDLSLAKDINRKVSWPKTQQISNKKQLSKLEEKATKAIEAES